MRRHGLALIVTALVVTMGAVGYAATLKTTYTSVASVLIRPVPGNPFSPSVTATNGAQLTVAMTTEVGLVTTPTVAGLASDAVKRRVPAAAESVTAIVPPNTQIIQIAYTAPTPASATSGAQTFAKAFLEYRANLAKANVDAGLTTLRRQLATADANLKQASASAASQTDPRSYVAQQVQLYADRVAALNDNISSTESISQDPGSIISAGAPATAKGMTPALISAVGIVVGLVLGLAVAVVRQLGDDAVDVPGDVEVAGIPILATLPVPIGRGPSLVLDRPSHDPVAEAYRRARAAIVARFPAPCVISVVSVSQLQQADRVAANLALVLAQAGYRASLISADPASRWIENEFRLPLGLAHTSLSVPVDTPLELRQAMTRSSGVDVGSAGSDPATVRANVANATFQEAVRHISSPSGYVILASAGAWSADGDAVSAAADTVILVATTARTTHAEVAAAVYRYSSLGVTVAGLICAPNAGRRARKTKSAKRHLSHVTMATTAQGGTRVPERIGATEETQA